MPKKSTSLEDTFATLASRTSEAAGSFWAFAAAVLLVLVWALTGPVFGFSEIWQLVINTGTTIITFLMVFVIQHAQNKDMRAVQLKLNELIAAVDGASNRLIDVENLTDREVDVLYHRFKRLATTAQKVSQGAKLTVDNDRDCGDEDCAENTGGPPSDSVKQRVPIKAEARGRKQTSH